MLMSDLSSEFYPDYQLGVFQSNPGVNVPVGGSDISLYKLDSSEQLIYWNFDEKFKMEFDYLKQDGHIFSDRVLKIFEKYSLADSVKRRLDVWMAGGLMKYNYGHLYFDGVTKIGRAERYEHLEFFDVEKSVFEDGIIHGLKTKISTGDIVLTDNALNFDCFQLNSSLAYISSHLVVTHRLANSLSKRGIRGAKLVPLNNAFKVYCDDYGISLSKIMKKRRPNIP